MAPSSSEGVVVHSAGVVVPVTQHPIADGSVATLAGKIVSVGERDVILSTHDVTEEVRWDGLLMPGMVNAHAHLQYNGLAHLGSAQHTDFEAWSIAFDEEYEAMHEREDWRAAALAGARLALASGTTTIADICTDLAAVSAIPEAGMSGVSYLETLGATSVQWTQSGRTSFMQALEQCRPLASPGFSIGVSPHAPYSLDTDVLADLAVLARKAGVRLHTHLAESAFEDEYYRTGTGQLAEFVATFGRDFKILADRGSGQTAAEFAQQLGLLGIDTHVAHGIYLDDLGRSILRETHTPVALCPRSNATIGLAAAPVAAYLTEGNHICVGTDSLSSAPSLDLLEDGRLLHQIASDQGYDNPDLGHRLIRAVTIDGARALGMVEDEYAVGALQPGFRANMAVLAMESSPEHAESQIITEGAGTCVATVIDGSTASGAA